jgi:hypothetical protein
MKRGNAIGILSAAVVAFCAGVQGQSNVYSLSIYSGGHSLADLCVLSFPFSPYEYKVTEQSWYEDTNGMTIMDLEHRNERDGIRRSLLKFQCGSNSFSIPVGLTRAKEDAKSTGAAGSGDLSQLVIHCVINRGGHLIATNAQAAPLSWVLHSRESEDIIILQGDHFSEVQKILEQTCGAPDSTLVSSAPLGNGRSITYSPKQLGVVLNLTGDWRLTLVSVLGARKDVRPL